MFFFPILFIYYNIIHAEGWLASYRCTGRRTTSRVASLVAPEASPPPDQKTTSPPPCSPRRRRRRRPSEDGGGGVHAPLFSHFSPRFVSGVFCRRRWVRSDLSAYSPHLVNPPWGFVPGVAVRPSHWCRSPLWPRD
jgi:hypothetical protein